ncbi:MAG: HpsJ family protein [Cyanobacteria bacterium P01_F01_bin.143]
MKVPNEQHILTVSILRMVGYGLLTMAVIDIMNLAIPLRLMNPDWEFHLIGSIIERIPVTFLGIVFVFYENTNYRTPIEKILLKIISWSCLVAAIFLILAIPLNINNAFRIYRSYNANINYQLAPRLDVIQDFQNQIEAANSQENLVNILQKQSPAKIELAEPLDVDNFKESINENLQKESDSLQNKAQNSRNKKRNQIFRKVVKYNLGALISIVLLIFIWKNTFWARTDYAWE